MGKFAKKKKKEAAVLAPKVTTLNKSMKRKKFGLESSREKKKRREAQALIGEHSPSITPQDRRHGCTARGEGRPGSMEEGDPP